MISDPSSLSSAVVLLLNNWITSLTSLNRLFAKPSFIVSQISVEYIICLDLLFNVDDVIKLWNAGIIHIASNVTAIITSINVKPLLFRFISISYPFKCPTPLSRSRVKHELFILLLVLLPLEPPLLELHVFRPFHLQININCLL